MKNYVSGKLGLKADNYKPKTINTNLEEKDGRQKSHPAVPHLTAVSKTFPLPLASRAFLRYTRRETELQEAYHNV